MTSLCCNISSPSALEKARPDFMCECCCDLLRSLDKMPRSSWSCSETKICKSTGWWLQSSPREGSWASAGGTKVCVCGFVPRGLKQATSLFYRLKTSLYHLVMFDLLFACSWTMLALFSLSNATDRSVFLDLKLGCLWLWYIDTALNVCLVSLKLERIYVNISTWYLNLWGCI